MTVFIFRVKRLTEEFERLNTIIQELRKENTIYKQNNYSLEMQLQQFASLDEKVFDQIFRITSLTRRSTG